MSEFNLRNVGQGRGNVGRREYNAHGGEYSGHTICVRERDDSLFRRICRRRIDGKNSRKLATGKRFRVRVHGKALANITGSQADEFYRFKELLNVPSTFYELLTPDELNQCGVDLGFHLKIWRYFVERHDYGEIVSEMERRKADYDRACEIEREKRWRKIDRLRYQCRRSPFRWWSLMRIRHRLMRGDRPIRFSYGLFPQPLGKTLPEKWCGFEYWNPPESVDGDAAQ